MNTPAGKAASQAQLPRGFRRIEHRIHETALHLMGLSSEDRVTTVETMFLKRRRDAVNYWLQLMLSMGIATLGLVLGSTAVVIGAMLIAPLMGPIVELGMALTIGSPALTVRSFARVAGSVVAVVLGAALLTLALPFHEITPEIASRTFPTALDLLIAIFVALAGAFTTVRQTSETTSAAAGTAIGIALVPPLCVMGFGLGIMDASVAGGATLLFLTNITAILFVSVVVFWLLGFEQVNAARWEEAALAEARPGAPLERAMRRVQAVYGSRYGRVVRVGVPALLIGSLTLPLGSALDQVAWEVRARAAVARILDQTLESRNAVQSRVRIAQRDIAVSLYIVGPADTATHVRNELSNRIAAATGVVPTVRAVAVPDMGSLRQATAPAPVERERVPLAAHMAELRQLIGTTMRELWPEQRLGPILRWHLEMTDSTTTRVLVRHWGMPGGEALDETLGRVLSERVGTPLVLVSEAMREAPMRAAAVDGPAWLPDLVRAVETAGAATDAHLCVAVPAARTLRANRGLLELERVVRDQATRVPEERLELLAGGAEWSVRLSRVPCSPADTAVSETPVVARPEG